MGLAAKNCLKAGVVGIILGLALYLRLFPAYFPQLKEEAAKTAEENIKNTLQQEVLKRYPHYSESSRRNLVLYLWNSYKKKNEQEIKKVINDIYASKKEPYQDSHGQTYLMELDGWHWARYVENVLRHGYPGDKLKGNLQIDTLMLAPRGFPITWGHFFYYLSAWLYKIFTWFKPLSLATFLFYLPLFFVLICLFLLYHLSSRWGGFICGVCALAMVGFFPTFLVRSCAGWFDTDALCVAFSLAILYSYSYAYKFAGRRRYLYLLFSISLLFLFYRTWAGWWYILAVIVLAEVFCLLSYLEVSRLGDYLQIGLPSGLIKDFKGFIFFCAGLFAWLLLLAGKDFLGNTHEALKFGLIDKTKSGLFWPNTYYTVAELKHVSFLEVANILGGISVVILMTGSVFWWYWFYGRREEENLFSKKIGILLFVWFWGMFFAVLTKGIRFVMYLMIPGAIFLGFFLADIYRRLRLRNMLQGRIFIVFLAGGIFLSSFLSGYRSARGAYPLMDDNWFFLLEELRLNTSPETIINSWWDYGNWYESVSGRRVIFDGQSQHEPVVYWMARALLTDDEEECRAILRMLNNGSNLAFELIDSYYHHPLRSLLFLKKLLSLSPQEGRALLQEHFPSLISKRLEKIIYYQPPPAVFVLDYTLVTKIPAISYLGNWDFLKAYITQTKRPKEELLSLAEFSLDGQQIEDIHEELSLLSKEELAEWFSQRWFIHKVFSARQDKDLLFFGNDIVYNLAEQKLVGFSHGIGSICRLENDTLVEDVLDEKSKLAFLIFFDEKENLYKGVLLDKPLAKSMFARLFFLKGKTTKHFAHFMDAPNPQAPIRVFYVKW